MPNAHPVRQRQGYRRAARPKGPLGFSVYLTSYHSALSARCQKPRAGRHSYHVLGRAKAREFVTRARFPMACDLFPARGNVRCGARLAEPATREEWRNDGRIINDDLLSMRREPGEDDE